MLFRKISENINYTDPMKLHSLMEEAQLNANFASLAKIDARLMKTVVKEILSVLSSYLELETREPKMCETLLKSHHLDAMVDFGLTSKLLS